MNKLPRFAGLAIREKPTIATRTSTYFNRDSSKAIVRTAHVYLEAYCFIFVWKKRFNDKDNDNNNNQRIKIIWKKLTEKTSYDNELNLAQQTGPVRLNGLIWTFPYLAQNEMNSTELHDFLLFVFLFFYCAEHKMAVKTTGVFA